MIDEIKSFPVTEIIFFLISRYVYVIVYYAHILQMKMMKLFDKRIMIAFDVYYFHSFIYALYDIIDHVAFFVGPFAQNGQLSEIDKISVYD